MNKKLFVTFVICMAFMATQYVLVVKHVHNKELYSTHCTMLSHLSGLDLQSEYIDSVLKIEHEDPICTGWNSVFPTHQ